MNLRENKYLLVKRHSTNEELLNLRGRYFVYFLFKNGVIVYIGSTMDIQQRLCGHKSGLWLKNWFTHFRIIECRTKDELMSYEKRWITKFRPRYNGGKIKRPSGSNIPYEKWLELTRGNITSGEIVGL